MSAAESSTFKRSITWRPRMDDQLQWPLSGNDGRQKATPRRPWPHAENDDGPSTTVDQGVCAFDGKTYDTSQR